MTKLTLFFGFLTSICLWAQDAPAPVAPVAPVSTVPQVAPPAAEPEIPDDGIRVAILGYHDFAEELPETAMRIHTSKFRKQMEAIRQLGLKVITLDEFTAWKEQGKEIPQKCILLTFDDGWKSVYTDAYPILKEFGYPFTLYLYKNYVDGGGKALTTPMIEEMVAHGATIGSHSVSHPYPITVKSFRKKGENAYDAYLRKEMGESKLFLESKFPAKVTSYSYPGGFYTEEMLKLSDEFGYTYLFTVVPGKIKRSLPNKTLPRYMILGNYDKIFELATTFRESQGPGDTGGQLPGPAEKTAYPVSPEAGAIINSRLPEISADLSTLENFDPATLSMKVSGFGEVPAIFTVETKKFSWQVNRRLRQPSCQVMITWKDSAGKVVETPLRWSFQLDRESAYLPDGE
ncbi:MAG: polysaccharide deacetylase family protein [Luteolibacter sp.]|uniref:polysaccharide deacetylase family protein n=1 Tax=Luteolibacter sp. TaxID=1962973 RepID=UPI003265AA45